MLYEEKLKDLIEKFKNYELEANEKNHYNPARLYSGVGTGLRMALQLYEEEKIKGELK